MMSWPSGLTRLNLYRMDSAFAFNRRRRGITRCAFFAHHEEALIWLTGWRGITFATTDQEINLSV